MADPNEFDLETQDLARKFFGAPEDASARFDEEFQGALKDFFAPVKTEVAAYEHLGRQARQAGFERANTNDPEQARQLSARHHAPEFQQGFKQ